MRRTLIASLVAATLVVPIGVASASEVVETVLVSRGSDGTLSNGRDVDPTISADGNIIAYSSGSTNLVPHDYNGVEDIFAYDRAAGITFQVSLGIGGSRPNDHSRAPSISADGYTIGYYSNATNLVANDTNGFLDVFAYDLRSGVTRRVSVASDGSEGNSHSSGPSVSGDGNIVVFESGATNLVAGDTNNRTDIFAHDLVTGPTTRVSVASHGAQGNGSSSKPMISADGKTVVFESNATNLVADDTSTASDIFAHDLVTGTTTRVSVASDGTQLDRHSTRPAVSADGMVVTYQSGDVFVYDRNTGMRTRVSAAHDGGQANEGAWNPAISADGTTITYSSMATNLVPSDTNNDSDIFVYSRIDGTTTRISVGFDGAEANDDSLSPAISADGMTITYSSDATNLVSGVVGPYIDVFVTDIGNAPEASGFNVTIAEDTPAGTELGTVAATDADGDPLSYSITTGNDAGVFAIGGGGTITLAGALDYETMNNYELMVTVSDGELSDTAAVTVDVTNVNESPHISGLTTTVAENVALGTVLGTVSASDQENDDLTFAITAGNDNGSFVIDDGVVTVAGALDYETTSSHDLNVEVSDGELLDSAIVTVDVTNVNEPPIVENSVTAVPEDTATGTELATVTASDPENDPLSFSITAGNDTGLFSINGTGVVRLVVTVDYESATQHVLTVTVSDGELSDTATVTINVTEADDVDPDLGAFTDTVGSIFAVDIEWLATSGITQGCNPPVNDEFCPDGFVTRGQMAAFLVRGLDLPATGDDYFGDDDGTIFEDAINRLAASGITKGCNPPTNDTFCPNGNVTRGQMAAFLVRALGYEDDDGGDLFTDDDGSIFEDSIDKLAAAGVTRGCNPPANTDYCPNNNVTRGQMAAFLHRAFR